LHFSVMSDKQPPKKRKSDEAGVEQDTTPVKKTKNFDYQDWVEAITKISKKTTKKATKKAPN